MNVEFAREQMIMQQVRAGDVLESAVLDAMRRVPREQFVPGAYRELAFADCPIPLPEGQCMMSPLQEGLLLQSLGLLPDDRVLEIGTGSGYLSACLASLADSVISVELFPELSDLARNHLDKAGIRNVETLKDDAMTMANTTRYDAIAITGSLPAYDPTFERWLEPGGRLFVIVGQEPIMTALRVTRTDDEWRRETLFQTVIPPLINAGYPPSFVF